MKKSCKVRFFWLSFFYTFVCLSYLLNLAFLCNSLPKSASVYFQFFITIVDAIWYNHCNISRFQIIYVLLYLVKIFNCGITSKRSLVQVDCGLQINFFHFSAFALWHFFCIFCSFGLYACMLPFIASMSRLSYNHLYSSSYQNNRNCFISLDFCECSFVKGFVVDEPFRIFRFRKIKLPDFG